MSSSYRFVVSGRVQGVYFRESTRQRADALGLSGWVRNLDDGRVEGLACGAAKALAELQRWLHQGPPAARVDALHWEPADEAAQGPFVVRR